MTLRFKLLDDGAFVCGDTETSVTAYAYPTSAYATEAQRCGHDVATEMMEKAAWRAAKGQDNSRFIKFDSSNWERLFDCYATGDHWKVEEGEAV